MCNSRIIAAGVAVLLLSACAHQPISPPPAPVIETVELREMASPLPLPPRPIAEVGEIAGEEAACFRPVDAQALLARDLIAAGNTEIGTACTAAYAELRESFLTQQDQAQALARAYALAAEGWQEAESQRVRDARKAHIEIWAYRVLVVLVVGLSL